MDIKIKAPPRFFKPRKDKDIIIADCGELFLEPNEQISFVTISGKRHDFAAKDWGFYATPSVNSRLKNEGFKTALVGNTFGQVYIMVVDSEKLELFLEYCRVEEQVILEWLDERLLVNE
jgi:hypothetical protein